MPAPISLLLTALLLVPPTADATGPTSAPATTQPVRDREPWVFRCVLDDNPRMLIINLGEHWWMAFNTVDGSVYKLWKGEIELTGAVYDTKHGPQPRTKGDFLLDGKEPVVPLVQQITPERFIAKTYWKGYALGNDTVVLRWRKGDLEFELQPMLSAKSIDLTYTVTDSAGVEKTIPDMVAIVFPESIANRIDGKRRVFPRPGEPVVIRIAREQSSASTVPTQSDAK